MYLGQLGPFAADLTSPPMHNPAALSLLQAKFVAAIVPALQECGRASLIAAKAQLRATRIYSGAAECGLDVQPPDGIVCTAEQVADLARKLVASGAVAADDPALNGIDLG
jgi:hypothetical protein